MARGGSPVDMKESYSRAEILQVRGDSGLGKQRQLRMAAPS
jgi:hypothetical protein